ncbi:MAG TPA: RNA 2',3'-cyclic phosphodiesterase [Acidimicrobiales bacterium]|nr:RNA 2',3'-cyclic phosphodiesterase [Acidimicrobiales bacterium]
MRLFAAVPVPDEVADLLAGLARPDTEGLRWTTREQWHVTLRFFGDQPDPEPIRALLPTVAPGTVAALGPVTAWFPGRRVLQIPVTGLEALAADVRAATARWARPDEEPYRGHLTLARSRRRPGPTALAGAAVAAAWPVDSVGLYRSTTAPTGARYERVG